MTLRSEKISLLKEHEGGPGPEGEARAAVSQFLATYKPRYSAEERSQLASLVPEQEYQGGDIAAGERPEPIDET